MFNKDILMAILVKMERLEPKINQLAADIGSETGGYYLSCNPQPIRSLFKRIQDIEMSLERIEKKLKIRRKSHE